MPFFLLLNLKVKKQDIRVRIESFTDTIFAVYEDNPKDLYGIWNSQMSKQKAAKKGLNVSFAAVF